MVVYVILHSHKIFLGMSLLDTTDNIAVLIILLFNFLIFFLDFIFKCFIGSWFSFKNWFVWSNSKYFPLYFNISMTIKPPFSCLMIQILQSLETCVMIFLYKVNKFGYIYHMCLTFSSNTPKMSISHIIMIFTYKMMEY